MGVAALLFSAIANVWLQVNQRGEEALMAHTEALFSLAQHLQQQDEILEVAIQDKLGRTMVRIGHELPIHEYLNALPEVIWAVPMVEDVLDSDDQSAELLGFVRITFDYDRIFRGSDGRDRFCAPP